MMLPAWAKSQKLGKRGERRQIAGGSGAPEAQVQRLQGQVEAPMSVTCLHAEPRSAPGSPGRDERWGFGGHVEAPV
jgi:hypothetical protein